MPDGRYFACNDAITVGPNPSLRRRVFVSRDEILCGYFAGDAADDGGNCYPSMDVSTSLLWVMDGHCYLLVCLLPALVAELVNYGSVKILDEIKVATLSVTSWPFVSRYVISYIGAQLTWTPSGGSRKKTFGGPGPSSFGSQQRLSEITIEREKKLGERKSTSTNKCCYFTLQNETLFEPLHNNIK